MRLSKEQRSMSRIWKNSQIKPYAIISALWIFGNVFTEQLEEVSFYLETSFAIAQWLVLRLCFKRIGYWILVSIWGWILAFILINICDLSTIITPWFPGSELQIINQSVTVQLLLTKIATRSLEWIIIGFFQYLLIRCYLKQTIWWILASAIAGAVKGGLEFTIRSLDGGIWGAMAGAFGYGIITSIALIYLLSYNFQHSQLRQRGN